LRVISRTSVMRYKNPAKALIEIAEELGVDALVEGSVLRAGNDVRITAQLIRGDSDEHMWAEYYDGTVENILKLQKDIALAIADAIHVALTADERAELRSAKRIDPEAYDTFIQATRFGGDWTPASLKHSLDRFEEVLRIAPDFGPAYTMQATAYYFMGMFGFAHSANCFTISRRAGRRAARLDENDHGAQTVLGWIALAYEWDWDEAYYRLERARAINSSNYFVYAGLGYLHALAGDTARAIDTTLQAVEIDPQNPPNRAYALGQAGEHDEAEEILRQLENYSGPSQVLFHDIALVNLSLGRIDAALDALEFAHRDREYLVALLGIYPVWDPLRDEPRFQRLVELLDYPTPEAFAG